jgi:hypothetical protein
MTRTTERYSNAISDEWDDLQRLRPRQIKSKSPIKAQVHYVRVHRRSGQIRDYVAINNHFPQLEGSDVLNVRSQMVGSRYSKQPSTEAAS